MKCLKCQGVTHYVFFGDDITRRRCMRCEIIHVIKPLEAQQNALLMAVIAPASTIYYESIEHRRAA